MVLTRQNVIILHGDHFISRVLKILFFMSPIKFWEAMRLCLELYKMSYAIFEVILN